MLCSRCEKLPQLHPGPVRLFLWAPLRHSTGKMLPWLRESGLLHELRESEECLVVDLDDPATQIEKMVRALTPEELGGTRALLVPAGQSEPVFQDFPRVSTLEEVAARAQSGWLLTMLEQKRLTSFFQPIVYAADPHRIFAHEALLRGLGSENELISPGRILPVAKSTGLLFQVDRAARMCAIQESVNCDLDSLVFINFMPTAIYDPVNCLQSTVRLITELKLPPERFVFEVVESEEVQEVDHLRNILDFYRRSGFGVALDDLGAGYASLNRVGELKPDYVKLDMKLIQGVHLDPFKAIIADRILSLARDLGIRTIVEGVEQPEELAWAQEHKADFVQGYYIARPANPPFKPSLKKS